MKRPRPAARAVGAALLALLACGPPRPRPPDLVLVTLCTFRYSHMGAAGYPRPTTPFLDSLAERGLFFENALSASSWTKPATASILTGLTPGAHRMTDFYRPADVVRGRVTPRRVLADELMTLAEALRGAGYATAARVNNVHVSEHFNMLQGFDDAVADGGADAARMVAELGRFAEGVPAQTPVFLFLLSKDPHVPYDPDYAWYRRFDRAPPARPEALYPRYTRAVRAGAVEWLKKGAGPVDPELATRYVDLYDAELAQQDRALAGLPAALERAGRLDGAFLFVVADHGEHLFDHGRLGHGARLDDAVLRVPLIITGPGIPAGRRVTETARSIDLYPTLAALAGAVAPDGLPGRDLLAPGAAGSAFASVYDDEHMVRSGRYALYRRADGTRELFDLIADPGETENLEARKPDVVARLDAEIESWLELETAFEERVAPAPLRPLADEAQEQLRDLGYLYP